ncbi:hypothetical protein AB1Y20_019769 [Prymnesium parvum]|uniref:30S ribosomal protein S21 n=1 Tax=Prymnesium parvum TaxID=97485 RepID=A0AB34JW40_PRYPA
MPRLLSLLMLVLSSASALVITPLAARAPVAPRVSSPQMRDVVRVQIELEQGEPLEKALRRFRKASNISGHLRLLRNRKTFESAHDKKIRKTKEGAMRLARARRSARNKF